MTLRPQDPIPDWISHILAIAKHGAIRIGERNSTEIKQALQDLHIKSDRGVDKKTPATTAGVRKQLVSMKDVNVAYHDRHVCTYPMGHDLLPTVISPRF